MVSQLRFHFRFNPAVIATLLMNSSQKTQSSYKNTNTCGDYAIYTCKRNESGKRVVMSAKMTKEMDADRVARYCVSSATVSASLPHRLLQSLVGLAVLVLRSSIPSARRNVSKKLLPKLTYITFLHVGKKWNYL